MSNILSQEQDENIHGFTGDLKVFLGQGDFKSALILLSDLRKYVLEIKKKYKEVKLECQK